MEEESSSSWLQETIKNQFETSQEEPKKLLRIVEILKKLKQQQFEIDFNFNNYYSKERFLKIYQELCYQGDQNQRQNQQAKQQIKRKKALRKQLFNEKVKKNPQKMTKKSIPFQSVSDSGRAMKLIIFQKIYQKKLQTLETEYDCLIWSDGDCNLDIYIKDGQEINVIMKNQIWQMMDQLILYYCRDSNIWQKLQFSYLLRKKIEEKNVFFSMASKKSQRTLYCLFYSICNRYQEMRSIIYKQLKGDLAIKSFFTQQYKFLKFSQSQNFKLVDGLAKQLITQCKETYQIQIQSNYRYGCFVIHCQNMIFASEPIKLCDNFIKSIILMTIKISDKSKISRGFLKKIREITDGWLKCKNNKNQIVLCINRQKLEKKGDIRDLLKLFKILFEDICIQTTIHVYLSNYYEDSRIQPQKQRFSQKKQILTLLQSQKYLLIQNYDNVMDGIDKKVIFKFRSFQTSEKTIKQLSLTKFLLKLIYSEVTLKNKALISEIQELYTPLQKQRQAPENVKVQQENIKKLQTEYLPHSLQIPYSQCIFKDLSQDKIYEQNNKMRQRQIQNILRNFGIVSKVIKISISQKLKNQNNLAELQLQKSKAYLINVQSFKTNFELASQDIIRNIKQLKAGQQGFIIYIEIGQEGEAKFPLKYLPIYKVKLI